MRLLFFTVFVLDFFFRLSFDRRGEIGEQHCQKDQHGADHQVIAQRILPECNGDDGGDHCGKGAEDGDHGGGGLDGGDVSQKPAKADRNKTEQGNEQKHCGIKGEVDGLCNLATQLQEV